ncbi:hypothetical protein TIFTF001_018589 [Ficus carica]|uniref:MULE transposase domain-containing protein n=1 Tax=Ficus carica TaxID=3494 RepID=A0AA88ANJ5_FICCA|nr:hypothetical protein TIFTF001_018589 [Ficus carica]
MLSKFPFSIDVLDEFVAEAIPPEVGESNHIHVQPFRDSGQSDEAVQPVAVNNLIIYSPIPPQKYFYMCLTASKHGWPHCRPVIVVDGSALKARFGEMLLAACGHDADDSIFPLAFGSVPSETNESWKWYFEKLRDSIGTRESLTIVADRHKGIKYAASIVYPDVDFGIYVQHLAANLKMMYKDFKIPMKTYFDGASRAYLVSEHQRHMESIQNRNPDMHRYILQANPKKWLRAYFNGWRYAIMTTNIAESLNSVDWKASLSQLISLSTPDK